MEFLITQKRPNWKIENRTKENCIKFYGNYL